jgi:hypothetical protein
VDEAAAVSESTKTVALGAAVDSAAVKPVRPPPPVISTVTAPPVFVAVTLVPVKFKLVNAVVSVEPSS